MVFLLSSLRRADESSEIRRCRLKFGGVRFAPSALRFWMLTHERYISHERSARRARDCLFGCSNCQPITIDREEAHLLPTPRRIMGKIYCGYESSGTVPPNQPGVGHHLFEQRCQPGVIREIQYRLPVWRREQKHDPASRLQHHAPIRVWAEWFDAFSGIAERISE